MKKFFTNGRFAVKWFLRMIPCIMILYFIVYSILFSQIGNSDLLNNSLSNINNITKVPIEFINNLISQFYQSFGGTFNFYKLFMTNISRFFTGVDYPSLLNSEKYLIAYLIFVPSYELLLSFIFLVFDVFQYMFTITSKFLNKGENIYE